MVLPEALPSIRAGAQPDKVIYYPRSGPIEILPSDPTRQLTYDLGILNMETQKVTEIPVSGLTLRQSEAMRSDIADPLYSFSNCLDKQGYGKLIRDRGGGGLYHRLLEGLWREEFIPYKMQAWDCLTNVLSAGSSNHGVRQQARAAAYVIAAVYELNLRQSDSLSEVLHEVGLDREANALARMVLRMKAGESLHGYKAWQNFVVLTGILSPQATLPSTSI